MKKKICGICLAILIVFLGVTVVAGCTNDMIEDPASSVSIPRPTPEPEPTPTPTAAPVKTDEIVKVADKKADKASLAQMEPLLNYFAEVLYQTGQDDTNELSSEVVWNMVYKVVTGKYRNMDSDDIYSIDDNTQFVKSDFLSETVYPQVFTKGDLPAYKGEIQEIKKVEEDYEFLFSLDKNEAVFSPVEYSINGSGDWTMNGTIEVDGDSWSMVEISLHPDENAIFGFTISSFTFMQ